jgi:hypothetical protein
VFAQRHYLDERTGEKHKHYYVDESVGIAVGMLLTALHLSGLAALTHTPSPMRFLAEILGRPRNEKAFASAEAAQKSTLITTRRSVGWLTSVNPASSKA